ncbi:MAG: uL13 family ribosomal protein [Candidatus Hodgkinia cicadicola]
MTCKSYVIDLRNQVFGRACSAAAKALMAGVKLIVMNVELVTLSKRLLAKRYWYHTGYPGGIKERSPSSWNRKQLFIKALTSMLPDNRLKRARLRNVAFCNTNALKNLSSETVYISV